MITAVRVIVKLLLCAIPSTGVADSMKKRDRGVEKRREDYVGEMPALRQQDL